MKKIILLIAGLFSATLHAQQIPPPEALENNVELGVPPLKTGSDNPYTFFVPAGAKKLTIKILGNANSYGDADLYVKYNSAPTQTDYDCRPYKIGNNETCYFEKPKTGYYVIMVRAYSTFDNVTIVGSFETTSDDNALELPNGRPYGEDFSALKGQWVRFKMNVSEKASHLQFKILGEIGSSGDADMYVKFGEPPTLNSYDCRPYLNGNEETCNIADEDIQVGVYYVYLYGYRDFSKVSIMGSYYVDGNPPPP
ncbi:PPC domain-containing protein [Aliikangiella sp. IMCC44359]|uniref:PPC domain-containing protein n=1 Tax=Aliikangiella sp. IMCC44359 TaxID=3459125 RepID=UPI00403B247B